MREPHDDALDLFFVRLRVVDPRLRCVRAWPQTFTQEFRSEVPARIFASVSLRQALPLKQTTILNSSFYCIRRKEISGVLAKALAAVQCVMAVRALVLGEHAAGENTKTQVETLR